MKRFPEQPKAASVGWADGRCPRPSEHPVDVVTQTQLDDGDPEKTRAVPRSKGQ
jgi:hypothetical protein